MFFDLSAVASCRGWKLRSSVVELAGQFLKYHQLLKKLKNDVFLTAQLQTSKSLINLAQICMYYVYLLRSIKNSSKTYVGYTTNIEQRLETHNSGGSIHTKEDKPWELVMYLAFDTQIKALAFEKYIKAGSGYSFAKRRFW